MKFEIKHRFSGAVLFSIETESWRLAIEAAVRARANLRGANLRGADLRGANLRGANLRDADLYGADLRVANLRDADLPAANLYGANLRGANLRGADLYGADLRGANLRGADLYGANLRGADLYGADLRGANLRGADLRAADLRAAKNFNKFLTTPLYGMLDQHDPIVGYKLVTAEGIGPFNGGIRYTIGQSYQEPTANTDEHEPCGKGINLASLDWCLRHYAPGYRILIAEFTKADIAAIPIGSDGKFRVWRCRIVGEKVLADIGIKPDEV